MIRPETINYIFQGGEDTHIHEQAKVSSEELSRLTENLGLYLQRSTRFAHDGKNDEMERQIVHQTIFPNTRNQTSRHIELPQPLEVIKDNFQTRLQRAGQLNNLQQICAEQGSFSEQINQIFSTLLTVNNYNTSFTPVEVIQAFQRPNSEKYSASYIPHAANTWSMTTPLNNLIDFITTNHNQIRLTQNFHSPVRRGPRNQLQPASYAQLLSNLQNSQQILIARLKQYLRQISLTEEECNFVMSIYRGNNQPKTALGKINIQKALDQFTSEQEIDSVKLETNILISDITDLETKGRFLGMLLENQLAGACMAAEEIYQNNFLQIEQHPIDIHRYNNHLNYLLKASIIDAMSEINNPVGNNHKTFLIAKIIYNIIFALEHDYMTTNLRQLIEFNIPDTDIEETFLFYFLNYTLLHLEVNQYTRFIKTIIQSSHTNYSELPNINLHSNWH